VFVIRVMLLCLWTVAAVGQTGTCGDPGTVRSLAGNFSADMQGLIDTRQDTWGTASAVIKPLTFKVPVGCKVQLVKLMGDFVTWPLGSVPEGSQAGTLIAMQRTGAGVTGSKYADWASDGTFLYLQIGTSGPPSRLAFNHYVLADGLLNDDNILEFKMAEWLNNTGRKIHMEVSFVVYFRFV